jgi:hypothetical protein
MEIEKLIDYLHKIGAHNFLAIGAAVIVGWLVVSGLIRGLRKKERKDEGPE